MCCVKNLAGFRLEVVDEDVELDALAMEVYRFRQIYNTVRPHQGLGDRTPQKAYLGVANPPSRQ